MKQYPSIPRSTGQAFREFDAHVFDKLDGSNMRFEWQRKRGWCKVGRRHGLLDDSNESLKLAPPLFEKNMAEPLARIAKDQRWDSVVVFCELWGPKSIGGCHEPGDDMRLTLFDVSPLRHGLIGPTEFRKLFEGVVETPNYLGFIKWNRSFVEQVRNGEVAGITCEGVVGKYKEGKHDLVTAKAKTQKWIDLIKQKYSAETAEKIINS